MAGMDPDKELKLQESREVISDCNRESGRRWYEQYMYM
jgi:hypothetical protein